jgi:hypothetical protein
MGDISEGVADTLARQKNIKKKIFNYDKALFPLKLLKNFFLLTAPGQSKKKRKSALHLEVSEYFLYIISFEVLSVQIRLA